MIQKMEIKHRKEINIIERDYTEQIEELEAIIGEMGQSITRLNLNTKTKWKDLFDALLEKDIRIQELEDKNEDLESMITLKDASNSSKVTISEYNEMRTLNSALQWNLRTQASQISELESANKDLTLKSK